MNPILYIKKSFFLISFFLVLSIQSCVHRVDRINVEGTLEGNPKTYVFISKLESDTLTLIDSIKTSSEGQFEFEFMTQDPTFITIGLEKKHSQIILLIQPGDEVNIAASKSDLSDYTVVGSYGSALVQNVSRELQETKRQIDSLKKIYEANLQSDRFDSIKHLIDSVYQIKLKSHKGFVKGFIKDNTFSPASILALFQSYDSLHPVFDYAKERNLFRLVDSTLMSVYSSNKFVLNYHSKIQKLDSLFERKSKRENMFKVGGTLPNVGFPLISGETFFYSSIWYRYLLIDFNGTWCELCKKNTSKLKSIYKDFSPKGLVVLQVSLGVNIDSLRLRIVKDSITWYNAGISDTYNSKLLDTLKISSIPSNYIIDRWGLIKGVNLQDEKLRAKLTELMPK